MNRNTRAALLAATLLAGAGGIAAAQGLGSMYDPAQLPALKGKVAQYDVTPRGDVDGLILDDGTEVHFPPHLGLQVVAAIRPGDAVTVHGLKARALPLVAAMSITADASNQTIVDEGPGGPGGRDPGPGRRPPHPPGPMGRPMGEALTAQGTIKMALHGPRGEVNGVLLDNGTMVHFPPPEATRLADQLKVGQPLAVRGDGSKTPLGTSIAARALGPAADKLTDLPHPPMPPRGGPMGGPMGGPGAPPPPPAP